PTSGGVTRMIADLQPILNRFLALEGVGLALVVGSDGLVIESAGSHEYDVDAVGAIATSSLGASQVLAQEVTRGHLVQSILEFERGLVIMEPIGEAGILLVLAKSASSIGQVRLVARRERAALTEALES
ncbi:MAG TPA: roadblock/LC7 domain-containing protein, partial [Chloroflexota bacterium]|nr:roadblock/LC7 domain-containing protein [Chloroflexota bacterium]